MTIPEFSVKRRITITMLILIITLFGIISFFDVGLDLLPDIEFPYVSIVTTYEGVGSEEIETLITKPIEEAVSTVEGVEDVTSMSSEGISGVYIKFAWGTNLDFAAEDVRESLSWLTDFLPADADTPMVVKFNTSDMPILEYGATGMRNTMELREYLDDTLKPRLERLEGVASVYIMGGKEREVQILVDADRLKATGLSLQDIIRSVQLNNLNISGGHVEKLHKEYLVRTKGRFESIQEIRDTVVSITKEGKPIHLGDIARVEDTSKEQRGYERTNIHPCVIIAVMKQSAVNTVKVIDRVNKELEKMQGHLPPGVELHMVFDQGRIINRSISSTGWNAILGGIIAVFVVYIFLRAIRPTLTIALAIPLSIITTFIGMYALGYTFNIMTLGGIALGVGLLVDNAVVVIENTFRHLEEGSPRQESAVLGATEVGLAITASTLTTMAVFVPMSLSQSIAGKLARPLSITVCLSLFASLFVAITIIPAIAATIFKKEKGLYKQIEEGGWIMPLKEKYTKALPWVLKHRGLIIGGAFTALIVAVLLTPRLGTEFMPRQDMPVTILDLSMPEGTTLEETDHLIRQIEKLFTLRDEVITCVSQVGITAGSKFAAAQQGGAGGVNKASVFVRFKDKEDREKSSDTIINEIREEFPALENVDYHFEDVSSSFFGSSSSPIDVGIYGSDLKVLDKFSDTLMDRFASIQGLKDIEKSLKKSKPEIHIIVDREKASKMGLSIYQVASSVDTAMLGTVAGRYQISGDEYDIRVRFQKPYRETIENLANVTISSPLGFNIPLSHVTRLEKDFGPITINRKNQERVVHITGTNFNRDLGSIAKDITSVMDSTDMPEGYFYDVGGSYEDMQTSFKELSKAFIVGILLIYMIMAAQFESFSQPFIVMFTLPLAYIGVIVGLAITGKTVSVPAAMGLIILMGIVVNNAIVMIDYINQLRQKGMKKKDAIIEGAGVRLRPILITSVTTICGMLPMAFSTGEGSEMRSPMAVSVAFGLLFAMVLTLFVIPATYSVIDNISRRVRKKMGEIVIGEEE
ncbi:MAG: efflux RND transporter permease subunit [Thermodesulfobacteriota bacterium]|nr:efflux RND transporter permease subunit [Thermodesulfobacteriota bacterium]